MKDNKKIITLETSRLLLRQYQDKDYAPFAMLNANPDVMEYFPSPLNRDQSDSLMDKARGLIETNGWGFWATEEKSTGRLIGMVGLHNVDDDMPVYPNIEIGWRLSKEFWGKGYATEAAIAARDFAFESLKIDSIISFTTTNNIRSQAVMKRIGMNDTGQTFAHPHIPESSPLREHVLYQLIRDDWEKLHS